MSICCVQSVPPDSSYKTFDQPVLDWMARLTAGLNRSIPNKNQTMGDLEREILQQTQGLERKLLEEASQKKADQSPPVCPVCGNKLSRLNHGHERTFQSRFGPVTIERSRGWCKRCKAWRFPADYALGLEEAGSASPSVQEMAALMASKMPVAEASQGDRAFDGREAAAGDARPRSPPTRQTSRAQTQRTGRANVCRSGQPAMRAIGSQRL